jgi:hypothetical protein
VLLRQQFGKQCRKQLRSILIEGGFKSEVQPIDYAVEAAP